MSDVSQGPGWWIASDNRWYPPESHPNYQASAVIPEVPQVPQAPALPIVEPFSLQAKPPVAAKKRSRRVLIGAGIAALAVIAVIATLVILQNNGIGTLKPGSGSATITWNQTGGGVTPPPQPFSGTIEGLTLTGTAIPAKKPIPQVNPTTHTFVFPSHIPMATWSGTLGGTAFHLEVSMSFGPPPGTAVNPHNYAFKGYSITANGTYGSQPVNAVVTINRNSLVEAFTGTIGNLKVSGTISQPKENGKTGTLSVPFTAIK
jgi:hypothetical protein